MPELVVELSDALFSPFRFVLEIVAFFTVAAADTGSACSSPPVIIKTAENTIINFIIKKPL
jgi:hypothetical protein